MCVAILTKPGHTVPNDGLFRGWTNNKDGGGFAYVENGEVKIEKGFLAYNPFQEALSRAIDRVGESSPFLIHMRIRTAGNINANNCHPFKIKNGAMIHNGTMFYPENNPKLTDNPSDTRKFATKFHNTLTYGAVKAAEEDILRHIGRHNKLAFLYNDKSYHIMNESAGQWVDGVWYSNSSCRVYSARK